MKSVIVFSTLEYESMARELTGADCEAGQIERRIFPDGERYFRIASDVNDRDVVLVGGTTSNDVTLELYDLASTLVENGASTLTLIVPWFGSSTMERAVKHGEAVTAKTRARLFSSIPPAKLGNQIALLDLHSEGIQYYFEAPLHPIHVYAKPVIEDLARDLGGSDFILGSTDAGRAKWVESLANGLGVPAAFVFKRRHSAEKTEVTAVSAKLSGERVVIYDDMIRTGGSLMNAARAYRSAGASSVAAVTTHGIFANDALTRLRESGLFTAIASTDSHPNARRLEKEGLKVRTIAPLFVPCFRRTT
ncbi:MAG TPA: ribose-phosphate diphosphokinase [Thermoanaerobaculia bacterium]|nr:ribose-phosphate diphosphokinase [Thermoanaerobaculia bacterium]